MKSDNLLTGLFGLPVPENPIIAVIDVPWYNKGQTPSDVGKGLQDLVGASLTVNLFDLDVANSNLIGFESVLSNGDFIVTEETLEKQNIKINGLIYSKVMSALRKNQIPVVIGGDNSVTFASIEAASKKVTILDFLQIGPGMYMKNCLDSDKWNRASTSFNIAARISNIGNIVQVGTQFFSEEELRYSSDLNNAKQNGLDGLLTGIGKTCPKVWTHFNQDLAREQFNGKTWLRTCNNIVAPLREWIWVSIDMDFFANNCNVLTYESLVFLLKVAVKSGHKIIGFDIVNIDPGNQKIAADLLYKISSFAAVSQERLTWRTKVKV